MRGLREATPAHPIAPTHGAPAGAHARAEPRAGMRERRSIVRFTRLSHVECGYLKGKDLGAVRTVGGNQGRRLCEALREERKGGPGMGSAIAGGGRGGRGGRGEGTRGRTATSVRLGIGCQLNDLGEELHRSCGDAPCFGTRANASSLRAERLAQLSDRSFTRWPHWPRCSIRLRHTMHVINDHGPPIPQDSGFPKQSTCLL